MISIFYSNNFLLHHTGKGHPESPERLSKIVLGLKNCAFADQFKWKTPRFANIDTLNLVHSINHINYIKRKCETAGKASIDHDTPICKHSFNVALQAAGAWLDGIDNILNKESSLALARPPGHHAESNRSMGFCIFSNAALSAVYALKKFHIKRV